MSSDQQIEEAIATLEKATQMLKDLGLIGDEDTDE